MASITGKNTVISPNFLVWKLCLSAKFPHQEIRWNYGIFTSEYSHESVFSVDIGASKFIGLLWAYEDQKSLYKDQKKSLYKDQKSLLIKLMPKVNNLKKAGIRDWPEPNENKLHNNRLRAFYKRGSLHDLEYGLPFRR